MSKIIIIGAGMAGLAAASYLKQQHYDMLVLEARSYLGGRTHTTRTLGIPFDHGAFIIHGINQNPMMEFVNQLSLPYYTIDFKNQWIIDDKGTLIFDQTNYESLNETYEELLRQVSSWAKSQPNDVSLSDAITQILSKNNYSDAIKNYIAWRKNAMAGYYGAEFSKISAKYFDIEEKLSGDQVVMLQGYQPIVEYLAKDIPIKLETVVNGIDYQNKPIVIKTNKQTFTADAVIVTVPLGVLQREIIIFNPPLPPEKQLSIKQLQMGVLDKIALKFDKIFWPPDLFSFGDLTNRFLNYYLLFKEKILLQFTAGGQAKNIEKEPDEIILEQVMNELRKKFGNDIPSPKDSVITRWANDPYAYGSYSFTPVGGTTADYDNLAKSVNERLFFAGEATTSAFSATTHGAYWSGLRAAKEIINLF